MHLKDPRLALLGTPRQELDAEALDAMVTIAAEYGRAHAIDHAYETLAGGSFELSGEDSIGEGCYIAEVVGAAEATGAVTKERAAAWIRDFEAGGLGEDPRVRAFCNAASQASEEIIRAAARKRDELARLLDAGIDEVEFAAIGPQGQLLLHHDEDAYLIFEPGEARKVATQVILDDLSHVARHVDLVERHAALPAQASGLLHALPTANPDLVHEALKQLLSDPHAFAADVLEREEFLPVLSNGFVEDGALFERNGWTLVRVLEADTEA